MKVFKIINIIFVEMCFKFSLTLPIETDIFEVRRSFSSNGEYLFDCTSATFLIVFYQQYCYYICYLSHFG